ncbi:biotin transporter BioY [Pleomorphomonas diazotrophica]|uniref:Biotin transporter n=1 Tax=Pleomorphomonas diazotrophica TaxID=1166257 RepID=A0A1I4VW07_9HYPH|nr:biotin transporter BioY [Pleomorphomonas diazotrophica]PKR89238.1 biotin transporter BioY [Pleomorphomonas diazotrophica]SFN05434.1 biotin transport system substrate-specific component [Pleomorphomonas diazotrophica]
MTTLNQPSTAFTRSLASSSRAVKVVAVVFGSLLIAAATQIEVPFIPVPMTMQTFAVLLVGLLFGARLGAAAVLTYLAEAAIGLPVLSGAANMAMLFAKPATTGYLVGFVGAAFVAGLIAERTGGRLWGTALAALAGEVVLMALGVAFLAYLIGAEKAVTFGFLPFVLGDALKIVLAVAVARGVGRLSLPTAI